MGGDEEEERGTGKIKLKGEDGWGGWDDGDRARLFDRGN